MNDANSVWDFLLLMLWFFFLVIWIMILFSVIGDLFRDKTESGFKKFLWCFFLIFAPFITALIYIIARGTSMTKRSLDAAEDYRAHTDAYIKQVAGSGPSATDQITSAKALLDAGTISQAEFDQLKAKALS